MNSNIFFTADPHFGWSAIAIRLRGFKSAEEWDSFFLAEINKKVPRNAQFYILGDFSYGARAANYRSRIKCKDVRLIQGNHDDRSADFYRTIFKHVWDTKMTSINGQRVFLSHYPHAYWDKSHAGSYHLYGHIHCGHEEYKLDSLFPDRRSVDVGPDSYKRHFGEYGVWSWTEIFNLLSVRMGHHIPGEPNLNVN